MHSLENPHRAPAYRRNKGLIRRGLVRILTWLLERPFRCPHPESRLSLPYNERQRCLQCGASRSYRFTRRGISKGQWRRDPRPITQFAREMGRDRNPNDVVPNVDGRTAILLAGEQHFQPLRRASTPPCLEWIPAVTNRIYEHHLPENSAVQG